MNEIPPLHNDEAKKILEEIRQLREEAQKERDAAAAARKAADDDAGYASKAKNSSEEHSKSIFSIKGEVDSLLTTVGTNKTNAEVIMSALTASKATADQLLEETKNSSAKTTDLSEKSSHLWNDLVLLEKLNKTISEEADKLKVRIEKLLPGAASAGLAEAFLRQKARLMISEVIWLVIFLGAIGGIVMIAAPTYRAAIADAATPLPWEAIFRGLVMRIPIVLPLVWLGVYAAKNYMLSIRLKEDYAYKEAISRAFEGYKREMSSIASDASESSPTGTLCRNVLGALSQGPERIYDTKQQDYSLLGEADELRKRKLGTQ